MNMNFNFNNPTNLIFGSGKLNELGEQIVARRKAGTLGKKALLLTSNGKSTKINGSFDRVIEQLKEADVEVSVCSKIMENPLKDTVMEAAAFAKESNCDFIVALGGGAVLDSAVAVSAMATNPGDLWDYVNGGTGKGKSLVNPGLPIVTIATSSGTGSEVNCWGVISNPDTNEKIGFGYPELVPVLAIVDPELMKTVPSKYTAYQGFDALFHNTEVMISNGVNILSETMALSAIESIAKYLPRAVKDGNDLEAREQVAYGSTIAGITMQLTSTTAQHSMEHAMSAYHQELPHGAGLIMISEAYYQHFVDCHACDERFIAMAKALGKADAACAQDFVDALVKLQKDCGVAELKMSDFGIQRSELRILAKNARETMGGLFGADPKEVSHEDCVAIFEKEYR